MCEFLRNFLFPKQVKIEKEILALADDLKDNLLLQDVENIRTEVEYNEFGLAFETLREQLFEYEYPISASVYNRIEKLGTEMGYSEDKWNFLRSLIKIGCSSES